MQETNGMGIAALVCSIIGFCLGFFPYFGLPLCILAIVFSSKQRKVKPTGQATTGLIIGIIGTVTNAVMLLFVLLMLIGMSAYY